MDRNRIIAIGAVIAIGAAFLAGYLPQRRHWSAAESEVQRLQAALTAAEARGRISDLLGEALAIEEVAIRQNYGDAQQRASAFFDRVRAEAGTSPDPGFRDVLSGILTKRDAITAALTKADTAVVETLHGIAARLRGALGYPTVPEPAAK